MPSTQINKEKIKEELKVRCDKVADNYGAFINVPKDELFLISEYERGMYVLDIWKTEGEKGNPVRFLRHYGVTESVLLDVVSTWCDMNITEEDISEEIKTEKRSNKYDAFISWTKDKIGEQHSTEALVEVAGFSYPTVLKFLTESTHFRKIKKGIWEIRDPKADREAEI